MVKVTVENITKVSEDALYMTLEHHPEGSDVYMLVDAEIDRRLNFKKDALKRVQTSQIESLRLTKAIQTEIQAIFEGAKNKKVLIMIEHFGQEFIEEYTIDETVFTVFSSAPATFKHNPSSWECDSIEEARSKMAQLIYYRIYNKFLRDATHDNVMLLKRVLG